MIGEVLQSATAPAQARPRPEAEAPARASKAEPKRAAATASPEGRHLDGHVACKPAAPPNVTPTAQGLWTPVRPTTAHLHVVMRPQRAAPHLCAQTEGLVVLEQL